MGLFFPNYCQFCFQNWWKRLNFKDKELSFPFLCLFPSPFRAVGDAILLSLLFPFLMPSYRGSCGRSYFAKKESLHGHAKASRNIECSQIDPHLQLAKCFTADPQGSRFPETLLNSCRKIFSCYYTDRLYKGERSRLESPLQRCSHTSLASPVLPYFEAVNLHLVFFQI